MCLFYMDPDVLLLSNESPVNLVDLPSLPFPHSISNVQAKKKKRKKGYRTRKVCMISKGWKDQLE